MNFLLSKRTYWKYALSSFFLLMSGSVEFAHATPSSGGSLDNSWLLPCKQLVSCAHLRPDNVRIRGQSEFCLRLVSGNQDNVDRDDGLRWSAHWSERLKTPEYDSTPWLPSYHQIYLIHCNQRVASPDSYSLTER